MSPSVPQSTTTGGNPATVRPRRRAEPAATPSPESGGALQPPVLLRVPDVSSVGPASTRTAASTDASTAAAPAADSRPAVPTAVVPPTVPSEEPERVALPARLPAAPSRAVIAESPTSPAFPSVERPATFAAAHAASQGSPVHAQASPPANPSTSPASAPTTAQATFAPPASSPNTASRPSPAAQSHDDARPQRRPRRAPPPASDVMSSLGKFVVVALLFGLFALTYWVLSGNPLPQPEAANPNWNDASPLKPTTPAKPESSGLAGTEPAGTKEGTGNETPKSTSVAAAPPADPLKPLDTAPANETPPPIGRPTLPDESATAAAPASNVALPNSPTLPSSPLPSNPAGDPANASLVLPSSPPALSPPALPSPPSTPTVPALPVNTALPDSRAADAPATSPTYPSTGAPAYDFESILRSGLPTYRTSMRDPMSPPSASSSPSGAPGLPNPSASSPIEPRYERSGSGLY